MLVGLDLRVPTVDCRPPTGLLFSCDCLCIWSLPPPDDCQQLSRSDLSSQVLRRLDCMLWVQVKSPHVIRRALCIFRALSKRRRERAVTLLSHLERQMKEFLLFSTDHSVTSH